MALTVFGFESGVDGATATAGNTGAAFPVVTGGTLQISTAWAASGTRSLKAIATSTSGASYLQYTIGSANAWYVEMFLYLTGSPSGEIGFFYFANGSTREISLSLGVARTVLIRDGGVGGGAAIYTSAAIPLTTKVKLAFFITRDATAGTARVAWSQTAPYTTWTSDSGLLTARNTGSADADTVRIGVKCGTGVQTLDAIHIDDWGYQAGGTDFPVGQIAIVGPATQASYVFFDVSNITGATGAVTYTATPATGVVGGVGGIFLPRPTGTTPTVFTVTAADSGTGGTASTTVTVNPQGAGTGTETVVWGGSVWA